MRPDIVFALPDIPYTPAPYSQKRLTKSNERTIRWLTDFVVSRETRHAKTTVSSSQGNDSVTEPALFAHLLGGSVLAARDAFAESMLEPLTGRDADALPTFDSIDDAVDGYVLDLVPIRLSYPSSLTLQTRSRTPLPSETLTPLVHASLRYLPERKPRLVTGASTPHEILRLVASAGIDLFDSYWAQRAADRGVAFDFCFPVQEQSLIATTEGEPVGKPSALNLYDEKFSMDFGRLSSELKTPWDAYYYQTSTKTSNTVPKAADSNTLICTCIACSPENVTNPTVHSAFELANPPPVTLQEDDRYPSGMTLPLGPKPTPHYTRAYIHHLLHTHEMTAHTFLVAHNLAVLEAFFHGIRSVLSAELDPNTAPELAAQGRTLLEHEISRFERVYDERLLWGSAQAKKTSNESLVDGEPKDVLIGVLEEAERRWREVEDLRGKGRLKREKEAALSAGNAIGTGATLEGDDGDTGIHIAAEAVGKASIGEGSSVVPGESGVEAGSDP